MNWLPARLNLQKTVLALADEEALTEDPLTEEALAGDNDVLLMSGSGPESLLRLRSRATVAPGANARRRAAGKVPAIQQKVRVLCCLKARVQLLHAVVGGHTAALFACSSDGSLHRL